MARFIDELKRTHRCGSLRAAGVGQEVVLFGWVATRRDHGGCIFIDLRDREGITQVVFDPAYRAERVESEPITVARAHQLAEEVRTEWVLGVRGVVVSRGQNVNPKLPTGEIEVHVVEATVFNRSDTPPFEIVDDIETREEVRLEYRYLDLRRAPLQKTLLLRSKVNLTTRTYLAEKGCVELETPYMVRHTPGGARNFIVPSRLSQGKFYALAESPQLFKQLFMVAGFDRYFQIVKCFRDEDLRLDRQLEFTQIDIELSFINQDDLFHLVEGLVFAIWKDALGIDLRELYPSGRFPEMSFADSMRQYGNDKPDLRFDMKHTDLTDLLIEHDGGGVPFFKEITDKFKSGAFRRDLPPQIIKALLIPASANFSRAESDKLEEFVKSMGAKGLARAKMGDDGAWTQSPLAKSVTPEAREAINRAVGARPGDLICFQFGKESQVQTVLANLRVHIAKKMGLIPEYGHGNQWKFLWVVNPPLFEYSEENKSWVAAHHAFTRPHDEHLALIDQDPGKVLCYRYDLVLNGFEIGGGSIRLHDPDVQKKVFHALGIGDAEAKDKFGFLLKALSYGAPPHGGIALGMDRLALLLSGAESLRDVIPFPKTQKGTDLMTDAPSHVAPDQLAELKIRVVE
ncbi:MAG TPA: aspartate--tRNA ligase [Polyangiaceae bacterium]